ncbi:MAG: hypothetical protein WBQ76_10090 [Candidatus Korobacteraceae bacterium]
MALDLTGVNAKVSRAKEHTQSVKDEVAAWMNTRPCSLTPKANADFTRWALIISVPKTADLVRWTLIVGDTINNLRSALDHLIYAIAVHESGSNPPPDEKRLAFPICDTPGEFKDAAKRIKSLTPDVRAVVESVQPYNRTHPMLPALLAILRDFNNTDKHKLLRLAYAATSSGDVSLTWKGNRSEQPMPLVPVEFNGGELKDGAEVMAVTFDRPAPDVECHFDVMVIIALWHGGKAGVIPRIDRDDFAAILALLTEEVEAVIKLIVAAVKV